MGNAAQNAVLVADGFLGNGGVVAVSMPLDDGVVVSVGHSKVAVQRMLGTLDHRLGIEGAVGKFMSATHMGILVKPSSTVAPGIGMVSTAMESLPARSIMDSKSNFIVEKPAFLTFVFYTGVKIHKGNLAGNGCATAGGLPLFSSLLYNYCAVNSIRKNNFNANLTILSPFRKHLGSNRKID